MKQYKIISAKSLLMALIISAPLMTTACSARKTSTVSSTEVRREPADASASSNDGGSTVEVTKTEQTTEGQGTHGIFGILWDVITLPFRALAAIL